MVENSFSREALLECGRGEMFGSGNAQLPIANMLMADRITTICDDNGSYGRGHITAELDIHPGLWFFDCHFPGDPVMPGCLGLDAMWQLVGFFLAWKGNLGHGRALGVGKVKFFGQVLPSTKQVRYEIDIKRIIVQKMTIGIANGSLHVDGHEIYQATDLRVGLFTQLESF